MKMRCIDSDGIALRLLFFLCTLLTLAIAAVSIAQAKAGATIIKRAGSDVVEYFGARVFLGRATTANAMERIPYLTGEAGAWGIVTTLMGIVFTIFPPLMDGPFRIGYLAFVVILIGHALIAQPWIAATVFGFQDRIRELTADDEYPYYELLRYGVIAQSFVPAVLLLLAGLMLLTVIMVRSAKNRFGTRDDGGQEVSLQAV